MGPQKLHCFCPKRFELLLSTDLLGGSKNKKTFLKKVVFRLVFSKWYDKLKKPYMSTHFGREKKVCFFEFRATAYQQVFSKLSCKCSVKFSERKISRVFLHSERNFLRCSQTNFWTTWKAHFRMPFLENMFWRKSWDFKTEFFGWCGHERNELHMQTNSFRKNAVKN